MNMSVLNSVVPNNSNDLMEHFAIVSGAENFQSVTARLVNSLIDGTLSLGADSDGTMTHAPAGEHVKVEKEHYVTNVGNNIHKIAEVFVSTGRPEIYVSNAYPDREFLVATEHGSVICPHNAENIVRIGDPDLMTEFRRRFASAQKEISFLKDVQIEDHKEVTGTLGFTRIINPDDVTKISDENLQLMSALEGKVVETAQKILDDLGADNMQVVPTVTPTNAVVEIIPKGACKAESLQWMREQGHVRSGPETLTAFAGDSNGDASVMKKTFNEGGICLGVGPKAPESHLVFDSPENLVSYLNHTLWQAVAQRSEMKNSVNMMTLR